MTQIKAAGNPDMGCFHGGAPRREPEREGATRSFGPNSLNVTRNPPMEGSTTPRMARERETIRAMIRLYCRGHHPGPERPCAECRELLAYALERLDRCPFQEGKTTCANCPVHCYKPSMRDRVRAVMRYSGPRMLLRHPILALLHLWDGRRKEPLRSR